LFLRILLLQGPVGGFFGFLARHLASAGHEAMKIDFNGGDVFFSRGCPRIAYRQGQKRWRTWFGNYCVEWKPDAVLVIGDQRPIHRIARRIAMAQGIRFFSFEEGYIRPNYVTFEEGGNNARSPVRSSWPPAAEEPAAPPARSFRPRFSQQGWKAGVYYAAKTMARPFFPGYLHHRRRALVSEFYFWCRAYKRKLDSRRHDERIIDLLRSADHPPFFMVALQVHDDLQLLKHGRGWRNSTLISKVTASFAAHAPEGCTLVFKVHPADRGHRSYQRRILRQAALHDVGHRVLVLQSGAFAPVVRNARGLITINSTAGIAALEADVPVFALGEAIYSNSLLVKAHDTPADLDGFWTGPPPPDPEATRSFINHIKLHSLLPGSYYDAETWSDLAKGVAAKLEAALR
jgi:capsular polysaccharide export protein